MGVAARGRAYPSIEDLDPANIADFGPHSVLLDFSEGRRGSGDRLPRRARCATNAGSTTTITHIAQVPSRSLLSRLTDHYLQIIANRAPIGFEAEFVSQRGHNTMYRGILMPFSSDEDTIDFIYGVINWKEAGRRRDPRPSWTPRSTSRGAARRAALAADAGLGRWPACRFAEAPAAAATAPVRPMMERSSLCADAPALPIASPRARDGAEAAEAPTSAAAPRSIARSASLMISRAPPRTRRTIMPNCSTMPASRRRRARR